MANNTQIRLKLQLCKVYLLDQSNAFKNKRMISTSHYLVNRGSICPVRKKIGENTIFVSKTRNF